ncbi:MAG: AbrB family transcriptional regulator [Sporolactobacillus sp.]|nr:AbrB family transcriptional regulator [Sporolactobacillus sp.]MCI1880756.1 AbrB family transcriptional regulator [Sporolactobacillus sp.]
MGNSLGTTYPKEILEHLHAKCGDEITFEKLDDGSVRISKRQEVKLPKGIDADFLKLVDQIIKDNDNVFRELANR